MSINATPSSTTANSIATIEEADAYFAQRLYADLWDAADDSTKEKAMLMAWRSIEDNWSWFGRRTTQTQSLSLPRFGLYQDMVLIPSDVIPIRAKEAQFEMALSLLGRNRFEESEFEGLGIASASIGDALKVQLAGADADLGSIDPLPPIVAQKLREFGEAKFSGTNGISFPYVERT